MRLFGGMERYMWIIFFKLSINEASYKQYSSSQIWNCRSSGVQFQLQLELELRELRLEFRVRFRAVTWPDWEY